MTGSDRFALRQRLQSRLRDVIGNETIEAKELRAFDLLMSRRDFVKTSAMSASVVALVGAGVPPTVWGRADPELHVAPSVVGLTAAEQASVTKATQLTIGTELFEETVYSQPVVATNAVGSHSLIEGARGYLRLQSVLDDDDPAELSFLDQGYHWGPPELVQLEDTGGGTELVHYRHPWTARDDGATTDGLVRQVIMGPGDGLVSPTQVLSISSQYNNQYSSGSAQVAGVAYLVVVVDPGSAHGGHLVIGLGEWSLEAPYSDRGAYPVRWQPYGLAEIVVDVDGHDLWLADRYTHGGHTAPHIPAEYHPEVHTEHIVLYYDNGIRIVSLVQDGLPGFANVMVDMLPYPEAVTDKDRAPRVVHLQPDVVQANSAGSNAYRFDWVLLMSSSTRSDGLSTFTCWEIDHTRSTVIDQCRPVAGGELCTTEPVVWDPFVLRWNRQYENDYTRSDVEPKAAPPQSLPNLDYSQVRDIHNLYNTADETGADFHVKLARFGGVGVALFAIANVGVRFAGHFPLQVPDDAGVGEVTSLTGGVSKFGGFRFVASDAEGNLFLFRQLRLQSDEGPYTSPIFAFNDGDGNPKTDYSVSEASHGPPLADGSNLLQFQRWQSASNAENNQPPLPVSSASVLYNASLAFASDTTQYRQGVWLGNSYQAAYAPRRFAFDSAHVAVKQAQGGSDDDYSAYIVHSNPVTRTWHQREIASQVSHRPPGQNDSGSHYQATVVPANAYGRPTTLGTSDNSSLLIEVRADVSTEVVDEGSNLSHNVDRYSSFMTSPDPATGRLGLLVKAETFAQVLYVRLVDGSALQPAEADAAMLADPTASSTPWQSFDMALQAQHRMGNDGSDTVALLGDAAPLLDTMAYITKDSLTSSSQGDPPWDFKSGFAPTSSNNNLGHLATYLNTSGQNLVSSTLQLSLGASPDGTTIDPLTAVTAPAPVAAISVAFGYPGGTVSPTGSGLARPGDLGSIWSGISHALHDALHWLQNVTDDVYDELDQGVVAVETTTEGLVAHVTADIMKAVTGVASALSQVVSTIEEYASVLVNIVVTIVEQSFLFKMIRDLILLLSLLFHLQQIRDLRTSLHDSFRDLLSSSNGVQFPALPTGFDTWDATSQYIGPANEIDDALGSLDSSNVLSEVIGGVLDVIANNPLTKKILNKVMAEVAKILGEVLPDPPITFSMDSSIATDMIDAFDELTDDIIDGLINVGEDIIDTLIEQVAEDAANPQQTFHNLASGLASMSSELAHDALEPVVDWIDSVAREAPTFALDALETDPFITIDITVIADLMQLFGIGDVKDDKVTLSAADAVFFPMAVVIWVAHYTHYGRGVSSVADLEGDSATAAGELAETDFTAWEVVKLSVDFVVAEQRAGAFLVDSQFQEDERTDAQQLFVASTSFFNLIRRSSDMLYTGFSWKPTGKVLDLVYTILQLVTAVSDMILKLPGKSLDPGGGWPGDPKRSDVVAAINAVAVLVASAYDTVETAESSPGTADVLKQVGSDWGRSQALATLLWSVLQKPEEAYDAFSAYIFAAPYGFLMQATAISTESAEPESLRVVLVAGSDDARGGDRLVVSRLASRHAATVTIVDDDALETGPLPVADLVLVSSSVVLEKVRREHVPVDTPLLVWEGHLFDDLGLAERSGETALTDDVIRFPPETTHPAADGRTWVPRIFDVPPARVNYAVGIGDATVLATERRGHRRPVYFAYDVGDTLADGSIAQARAIGWFTTYDGWNALNATGWHLFDAAVDWLLS